MVLISDLNDTGIIYFFIEDSIQGFGISFQFKGKILVWVKTTLMIY